MLKENIKNLRKSKGLSQEELAVKLHVVRQTVSKWENGLSVPDAAELISLAEELDTPVGVLLGETVPEHEPDDMTALPKSSRRSICSWPSKARLKGRPSGGRSFSYACSSPPCLPRSRR